MGQLTLQPGEVIVVLSICGLRDLAGEESEVGGNNCDLKKAYKTAWLSRVWKNNMH